MALATQHFIEIDEEIGRLFRHEDVKHIEVIRGIDNVDILQLFFEFLEQESLGHRDLDRAVEIRSASIGCVGFDEFLVSESGEILKKKKAIKFG